MPPYRSLLPLGDRGAVLFALNAERGPMLLMNGSNDTVMDIPHHPPAWFASVRARTLALLGSRSGAAQNIFTTIVYPGVSHRTSWVEREGVAWLNDQLHFTLWTAKTVADEPTTHIGDWVKANNVYLAGDYTKEDREAGLKALGRDFPPIARNDLMALPNAQWLVQRERLTYPAWADKAAKDEAKAPLALQGKQ